MMRRVVWTTLGLILAALLLSCAGLFVPLELAFALATGWAYHLGRTIPDVTVAWDGVALAALCLAGFGVGLHGFLRWLTAGLTGAGRWKVRWTASIVATTLLMFAAGMSSTGLAHQVGWLIRSPGPLFRSSGAAARMQSSNNLKQIGLAIDAYHQVAGHFPRALVLDDLGRPLHGWMASVLPYLERQDLHDQIDLGRPWNDPRNAAPYRTDVNAYLLPQHRADRVQGGYAPAHYAGNIWVLGGEAIRTLEQIPDGTSNTILAGEAAGDYKPWGDPVNWRDPTLGLNRSPRGFGGPSPGGANILFADGSVRFLRDDIKPTLLEALATPAGGETINPADD